MILKLALVLTLVTQWFLQRMITFKGQGSPLNGNQISVRTPRIVHDGSTIFGVCQEGNIARARTLFFEGLSSKSRFQQR